MVKRSEESERGMDPSAPERSLIEISLKGLMGELVRSL